MTIYKDYVSIFIRKDLVVNKGYKMRDLKAFLWGSRSNLIRIRVIYAFLVLIVIFLGLSSRKYVYYLPDFLGQYAGDTLWATMVYFGFAFIFNKFTIRRISILSLIFSYGIEISQLYQGEWINSIRRTLIGSLVLGHGFLFSDLLCYTVGICIAMIIDKLILKKRLR